MIQQQYTPFMTSAAEKVSQGLMMRGQRRQEQETGQLMGNAIMGDQQALQNLYMMNPKLAAQVQQRNEQMAATSKQASMQKKIDFQNKVDSFFEEAYSAPDYETAKATFEQRIAPWGDIYETDRIVAERFTPEVYETGRAKQETGLSSNRVVNTTELGGGAMQITYAGGRVEVITPTDEQRKAIQLAQKEQISYEEALNKARGKGRTEGGLEAEIAKHPEVLAMQKELEEMKSEVAASQKAKISEIEAKAKIESDKIAAAQTYEDLLPSLDRFESYVNEGIYGGTWGDTLAKGFSRAGIVVDQGKLDRTARAKMIATQLKFMAKPKGMGAMSDSEWAIIRDAIPDPDSATMSEIQAGIDEFKRQLIDKMAITGQPEIEVDVDKMTEEQLDEILSR